MFSEHGGLRDSSEAKVMEILEALRLSSTFYHDGPIIDSDSTNYFVDATNAFKAMEIQFHFK